MEVFKLMGSIMIDSKDAENSISKTEKKTEGLATKLGQGVKTAAKWGTAIVGAATAVGGAMIAASKDTASNMDVIDKASQRMGISAESYQELAYQAGLCGVEMSTMEKAAKKLEGTDMSFDDAIEQIYSLGTAEERSAKAAELFGDTVAYQMSPMLNASAEDMKAMAKEANDLGLVIDSKTVASGASLNDMFSKVEGSLSTLKTGLMTDIMPYIASILQWVIDNMPMIQETVKGIMDNVMPIVKTALDFVMALLPPLLSAIKKFLDWIMPYLQPILSSITTVIGALFKLINGDFSGFASDIKTALKGLATACFSLGKDIITGLWNGLKNMWTSVKGWFDDKVEWIKDKLSFWNNSQSKMSGNAHASGLAYVPYDNYPALLHRGERVLNANDARDYSNGGNGTTNNVNLTVYGAEGQNVQELADIIMREIQNATERRGRVFA